MTLQTLNEQLLELRLPAFRQALQEQQSNPQYMELAFEERLALLMNAHNAARTASDATSTRPLFPYPPVSKTSISLPRAVWSAVSFLNWDNATGSPPART